MAMIQNSTVTNIDWKGVADELGIDKIGTAKQRWYRFKAAKFGSAQGSPKAAAESTSETTPKKRGGAAGKKRAADEMNDGDDEAGHQVPAKNVKAKKIKLETPATDENGEEDGELEKGVSKDKGDANNDASGSSAFEA